MTLGNGTDIDYTSANYIFIIYVSAHLLVIVGTVIVFSYFLEELFDWIGRFFANGNFLRTYTYLENLEIRGAETWKATYPESRGDQQSPINIDPNHALVLPAETLPPLQFSMEYYTPPCDLQLYNDGHCLTLYGRWINETRPTICGGPLDDNYHFVNARFCWGPYDDKGSEHTINLHKYAMELQATYVRSVRSHRYNCDLRQAPKENALLLIISYFFQVVPVDNPNLKPLIRALKMVKYPFNSFNLEPAPISSLMPSFYSKYYSYSGSLTYPPYSEGVQWLIQPEPLGISSRQIRKFRKLDLNDDVCPMELNTRPVQSVNCREICFYD